MLLFSRVYCWLNVCIVVCCPCELFLLALCIVVGWPCVLIFLGRVKLLLFGCVYR